MQIASCHGVTANQHLVSEVVPSWLADRPNDQTTDCLAPSAGQRPVDSHLPAVAVAVVAAVVARLGSSSCSCLRAMNRSSEPMNGRPVGRLSCGPTDQWLRPSLLADIRPPTQWPDIYQYDSKGMRYFGLFERPMCGLAGRPTCRSPSHLAAHSATHGCRRQANHRADAK